MIAEFWHAGRMIGSLEQPQFPNHVRIELVSIDSIQMFEVCPRGDGRLEHSWVWSRDITLVGVKMLSLYPWGWADVEERVDSVAIKAGTPIYVRFQHMPGEEYAGDQLPMPLRDFADRIADIREAVRDRVVQGPVRVAINPGLPLLADINVDVESVSHDPIQVMEVWRDEAAYAWRWSMGDRSGLVADETIMRLNGSRWSMAREVMAQFERDQPMTAYQREIFSRLLEDDPPTMGDVADWEDRPPPAVAGWRSSGVGRPEVIQHYSAPSRSDFDTIPIEHNGDEHRWSPSDAEDEIKSWAEVLGRPKRKRVLVDKDP